MALRTGSKNKRSLLAHDDLERLGVNALENVLKTRAMALDAFTKHRGLGEGSDAGVGYLGIVLKVDLEILALQYAKMSAIAFKDFSEKAALKAPITTKEAVDIIKNDPFSPREIREIPSERIIQAMKSNIREPSLPGLPLVDE